MKKFTLLLVPLLIFGSAATPSEEIAPIEEASTGFEKLDENLYRAYFRLPRSRSHPPFIQTREQTFEEWFEGEGITFQDMQKVSFDPESQILEVVHGHAELSYIRVLINTESTFAVKTGIDIYEISRFDFDQLLKLIPNTRNHAPALAWVQEKVGKGAARTIIGMETTVQSGEGASVAQVEGELTLPNDLRRSPGEGTEPDEGPLRYGTFFEVEPTTSFEGSTIDLVYTLVHHSSAPELGQTEEGEPFLSTFENKIVTQSTVDKNVPFLAASWNPRGPRFSDGEVLHLLFVHARTIRQGAAEQVRKVRQKTPRPDVK